MLAMRQSPYDTDTHERHLAPEHGQRRAPRSAPPAARAPIRVTVTSAQVSTEGVGVYVISVAARLLDMHPQTLRKYERLGLIQPSRTIGSVRLYSRQELQRLRLIKHLVDEGGINLAGVQRLLSIAEVLQRIRPLMDEGTLSTGSGRRQLLHEMRRLSEMLEL